MIGARLAFISTLVLGGLFSPVAAEAQEAAKVARIGYLGTNLAAGLHMQEAFLALDSEGRGRSVEYAPSLEDISWLLLTAAHCIVLGGDAVAATFDLPYEARAVHLRFIDAQYALLGPRSNSDSAPA